MIIGFFDKISLLDNAELRRGHRGTGNRHLTIETCHVLSKLAMHGVRMGKEGTVAKRCRFFCHYSSSSPATQTHHAAGVLAIPWRF